MLFAPLNPSHPDYQRLVQHFAGICCVTNWQDYFKDVKVFRVTNKSLRRSFKWQKLHIRSDLGGGQGAQAELLYTGSAAQRISSLGFDLADTSKSYKDDRSVTLTADWSAAILKRRQQHPLPSDYTRQILVCQCLLGRQLKSPTLTFDWGEDKWHSKTEETENGREIKLQDCEQALPIFLVEYKCDLDLNNNQTWFQR